MAAYYDTYDYPSYWVGRDYEHQSEVIALKKLLSHINKIYSILDIGAGYGRLTKHYSYRAKKISLSDPSSKLLKLAKANIGEDKRFTYIHSTIDNLPKKIGRKKFDLIILIRVLHHIEDIDSAFKTINGLLDKNGYFIFEFANKNNFKSYIKEFLKGNITFPIEIFPKEIKSSRRGKTIPFLNYHPDDVKNKLGNNGFTQIHRLSVSNLRNSTIKKQLPLEFTLALESILQKPMSLLNFGPSIFILAKKIG